MTFRLSTNTERLALIVGVAGVGVSMVGWLGEPQQFFVSYLQAFGFWMAIPLGCLGMSLVHGLVGGAWGRSIEVFRLAGMRTLPLVALLFLPVLLGANHLYEWTRPEVMAHSAMLQAKKAWLNFPFFVLRAGIYLVLWIGLGWLLRKRLARLKGEPSQEAARKVQNLSGVGMLLTFLSVSFAAFDWFMSVEPDWFSSIYGAIVVIGLWTGALTFILILIRLAENGGAASLPSADNLHDLGKFLLMSVMLWAYFSFSQYLIVWSGQLPEELLWYVHRNRGGWRFVGMSLIVAHFFVPFGLLLSRRFKRNTKPLVCIASIVFLMRSVDWCWWISPAFRERVGFHWLDTSLWVGLGGIVTAVYLMALKRESGGALPPHPERLDPAKLSTRAGAASGPQDRGV